MSLDISQSIHQLASSDHRVRELSAVAVHRVGVNLCRAVVENWSKESEFRRLLISGSSSETSGPVGMRLIVGVAVEPANFEAIRNASGNPRLANVPPDQDALEFELHFSHAELDILTTKAPGEQGAIARFLSKFGEGIQQVELYVSDIDRATELLKSKFQISPIYPATRAGADGTRVNFFLVATPDNKKILVELVEDGASHAHA
jgi:hypothetical protein